MGTWFGLGFSCFFWLLLIAFGVIKLIRLLTGSNPLISAAPELDYYGVTDEMDLADPNLEMLPSFQVTDFYSQQIADDPDYFQWTAFMVESDGLVNEIKTQIPIKRCEPDDFSYFSPSTKGSKNKFESMSTNGQALCLEREDEFGNPYDFRIWGASETTPHRRLDISFMPCTPVVTSNSRTACSIRDNSEAAYANKLRQIK
jgi:hypothetical protein